MGGGYDEGAATRDATMTPMVPDANRLFISVGGGVTVGDLRVDTAYQFALFDEREVSSEDHVDGFGQKYANSAHLISLALTWEGGEKPGAEVAPLAESTTEGP
jgi:long-subunit fatty acid transport protein